MLSRDGSLHQLNGGADDRPAEQANKMSQTQNFSRRAFMVATAAGAACCSDQALLQAESIRSAIVSQPKTATAARGFRLDEATCETFAELLGTRFVIRDAQGSAFESELLHVDQLMLKRTDARPSTIRKPFSLVFRMPTGCYLAQATCHIEHQQLGQFELFLVPFGLQQHELRVEAIFS